MRGFCSIVAAVLAATCLLSCTAEDDPSRSPARPTYAFQGKVDPRFVGEWHTDPAPSALTMNKDGSLGIVAVTVGPGGRRDSKLKGSWLVSGSDLLLKYASPADPSEVVLKYSAKLDVNTLKLVQAGNGIKSTYRRVSK